jgi:2-oxo-4-hydroxy-4-carboxy-5-ureidoimidazoline decarboxylase
VAGHRPYPDVESLIAAADEAFYDLPEGDLCAALRDESSGLPVVLPGGGGGSGVGGAEGSAARVVRVALGAAVGEYRERFGWPFVVSLEEFPADEALDQVLHALRTRLGAGAEAERGVAGEELRKLTVSRVRALVAGAVE